MLGYFNGTHHEHLSHGATYEGQCLALHEHRHPRALLCECRLPSPRPWASAAVGVWQLTKEQFAGNSWRILFMTFIRSCQDIQQHNGDRK
jgi:hypothetical protein